MKAFVTGFVLSVVLLTGIQTFAEDTVVASISVTPAEATLAVGDEATFTAEAKDADGATVESAVTWTVEGEIGTVDDSGEFTATTAGTGTVVASVGDISGSAAVSVTGSQSGQGGQPGDQGGQGESSGDTSGNGEGPGEEQDDGEDSSNFDGTVPVEIFPKNAWAPIGDTIQFHVALDSADANVDVVWSVDNTDIGTIDASGLFTAVTAGETFVVVTAGENSDQAPVTVTVEGPPESSGNMIRVQRRKEDGKTTQFGSPFSENGGITIGGIPHPYNYLNGMKLFFPEDSISEDIVITINIPKFAKTDKTKKEVTFEGEVVTGVTFEVSVDGEVVEPYYFDSPIEVTMPYKKGLLAQLGIDPEELGIFYMGQDGQLERAGISNLQLDKEKGQITGECAHFSDVVLAPDDAAPLAVEDSVIPADFELGQNYPNPFNPTTTITYSLTGASHVKIGIFNVVGQRVITLVDGMMPAGAHSVVWNGTNENGVTVTNGVYFYRMEADSFTQTRKLVLIK